MRRDHSAVLDGWSVAATVAGNALEFYDFLAYSTFAVYIGRAFFPSGNGATSLLLALATFGVGFLTRPLGAVWIGAYADRAGRRPALTLTITLMTLGTLALVVTPTYASIGMAAPVILVAARLVQGLALGGEVGPATAVLLEGAPSGRRGAFVSWQGFSQGAAIFTAGIVGIALSQLMDSAALAAWGWRVPFALGLCLIPFGIYIRRRLPETLADPGTRSSGAVLRNLWAMHRRTLVLAVLTIMSLTISTYVNNYMTTYALTSLGMPAGKAMFATLANGAAMMTAALVGGRLCDRFGRTRTMIVPRVLTMLVVFPAFLVLLSIRTPVVLVSVTVFMTLIGGLSGTAALTALTESLPNESRGSGMAIAYAIAVTVFGGTTQFMVAWLIQVTGDRASPAYYVIATSAISVWAMAQLGGAGSRARATVSQPPGVAPQPAPVTAGSMRSTKAFVGAES